MKKILLVNTEYREFGGEDANIIEELNLLKKIYDVELLNFSNKDITLMSIVSFFFRNNYSSNKIFLDKILEFKPDVVYIHNTWFKANLGIFKIIKKHNLDVILKVHNYRFDCARYILAKNHLQGNSFCQKCSMSKKNARFLNKYFNQSLIKSFLLIFYSKRYFKILIKDRLKIICLNNFQKDYMVGLGIDKSKLLVISNPINLKEDKNKYNPNSDYVVYAGRIESKGVELLINAWLNASIKGIKLKIIGDGKLLDFLVNKYDNNNINFLGQLSNSETIKYISTSRAVLTATLMYEGQPRLLSEASMMGVPSIYPFFGGMPEFFPKNYKFSFEQFNYNDLIKKINMLNDLVLLKNLSNSVYKHSLENFSNNLMLNNYKNIFNSFKQ